MKPLFLLWFLLLNFLAHSQHPKKQSLELKFQIRQDKQADYITRFGTVSFQNDLQLYGTSIGLDFGYKRLLKNNWFIKPAIGYYKFTIDKIINYRIPARPNDPTSFRLIDFRADSMPFGYSTKNYHYNNISLGLAIGKEHYLNNNYKIITGLNLTYLVTYSQHYEVGQNYNYRRNVNKSFGYIIDSRIGIKRDFGKLNVATSFVIPVYKKWMQDAVFMENSGDKVQNWLGGYGLSLTIGKYLE